MPAAVILYILCIVSRFSQNLGGFRHFRREINRRLNPQPLQSADSRMGERVTLVTSLVGVTDMTVRRALVTGGVFDSYLGPR